MIAILPCKTMWFKAVIEYAPAPVGDAANRAGRTGLALYAWTRGLASTVALAHRGHHGGQEFAGRTAFEEKSVGAGQQDSGAVGRIHRQHHDPDDWPLALDRANYRLSLIHI